jgi:hypothetical protein
MENDEPKRKDGGLPRPRRSSCARIAHGLGLPENEVLKQAGYPEIADGLTYLEGGDDPMTDVRAANMIKKSRANFEPSLDQMLGEIVLLREQIHKDQHDTELSRERTLAKLAKLGAA